MQRFALLLFFAIGCCTLSFTVAQSGCNCVIPTDQCCNDWNNNGGNPTCYNPNLYQCNNGDRLCPKGLLSCGKDCYNPTQFGCANGILAPLTNPCLNNNGGCGNLACCPNGGGCYNPNHQACTSNGLVWTCFGVPANNPGVCLGHGECIGLNICNCTGGYSGITCQTPPSFDCNVNNGGCANLACCATGSATDHCFNPNHRKCTPTGLVWNCNGRFTDDPLVCSGHGTCVSLDLCSCAPQWTGFNCQTPSGCNCYIPTDKCCHDLNNNNGNPTCYNPSTHQCNDGNRLCPIGRLSCGSACYDSTKYQCVNGNLVPK